MFAVPATRGVAFLLGFGFAFLPSFGPFAALLFVLTARLRLKRGDAPWLAASVLSAVALGAHGGVTGALFGLFQVLGPWAVYRAFAELRQPQFEGIPRSVVLQGLFVGFAFVVMLGLGTLLWNVRYPPFTWAGMWGGNPALFAHMALTVGTLVALLSPGTWMRLTALTLAGAAAVATGRHEAAYGLLIVLGILLMRSLSLRRAGQGVAFALLAGALVLAVFEGPAAGSALPAGPSQRQDVTAPVRAGGVTAAGGPAAGASGVSAAASHGLERPAGTSTGPAAPTSDPANAVTRLTMWRVAVRGFIRRPWLGWGPGAYPGYFERVTAGAAGTGPPAHAHDLFLQVLFGRGLVGFAGLVLLLVGFVSAGVRRADIGMLAVFAAVLCANVFDYTFFFGGVIYPLAAVAGWRSGERTESRPALDSISRQFIARVTLAAVDLGLALAGFRLSGWLLTAVGPAANGTAGGTGLATYLLVLWPAMAWREGLYPGYGLTEPDELKRQVLAATYAGSLLLVGTLFFGSELRLSAEVVLGTMIVSWLALPMGRAAAKRGLRAVGLWGRPVVILGGGTTASTIAQTLKHRSLDGLRPVGVFADDVPAGSALVGGVPHVGPISAANTFARREGVHHAIVAMEPGQRPFRLPRLDPEENAFTIVQYVPDLPGLPVLGVRASSLDNLVALEVRNELASPVNRVLKRVIDMAAVVVGGTLASPVLIAIAVAIRLDSSGPLFFSHVRLGRGSRTFRVWKFRTMVKDAEVILERHLTADPALRAEWDATHKLKNDPRITRVGRILRRFSLDELPQLWNVLKGDMSLVGPRPIVEAEVGKYADAFDLYRMVRPGMTGYWQISGRSDTDYLQRVALDSFYVRNWSVWLDVVVLLKTVSVVLKRDGAY